MIKRQHHYIGHHRRFLALTPPTRPTASGREIERLERENAELRQSAQSIKLLCESLPDHSGQITNENKRFIIETINAIYFHALNITNGKQS
jgi:hypothetical protein